MDLSEEINLQSINQCYKIWKKNAPYLYDLMQSYELSTCSHTVEWFSEEEIDANWRILNLLLGTNSLAKNYFQIAKIGLPTPTAQVDYSVYQEQKAAVDYSSGNYVGTMGLHELQVRMAQPQSSEVLRARINPIRENIVAIKTGGFQPQVLVYDIQKNQIEENCVHLEGHNAEGFGLDWSLHRSNCLVSCSYDRKILLWDINYTSPIYELQSEDGVEDVKLSKHNEFLCVTAHQNQKICFWDFRIGDFKPVLNKKAHSSQVYSIDFNKYSEYMLLSAGQDSQICLWDIRNMSKKVNNFSGHNGGVSVVAWNPNNGLQFASGSHDRRVVVWDIQQLNYNTKDNPSNEIIFIHGGHRTKVTDVSWAKENNLLASCEENNTLQVWRMTESMERKD